MLYNEKSIWHKRYFIYNARCLYTSIIDKTDQCQQHSALFKAVSFWQEWTSYIPFMVKQRKSFSRARNEQERGWPWFILLLSADGCCKLIVANWQPNCCNIFVTRSKTIHRLMNQCLYHSCNIYFFFFTSLLISHLVSLQWLGQ